MIQRTTDKLFRGRPKSQDDLNEAWNLGIRTIVSLETGFARMVSTIKGEWCGEREAWEAMGGTWVSVPCSNFSPPSKSASELVNNIIKDNQWNTLIHCFSDVDRTGWICAYHKFVNGWFLSWGDAWSTEAVGKGQHWWFRWWKPFFWLACRRKEKA